MLCPQQRPSPSPAPLGAFVLPAPFAECGPRGRETPGTEHRTAPRNPSARESREGPSSGWGWNARAHIFIVCALVLRSICTVEHL